MYVVAVTIFVKPEFVDAFIQATLDNARNTRKEPANLRFDVLKAADDSTSFMLYEAYTSKEGFAQHQQTAHYARWKAAVADWMEKPRIGLKFTSLFFGDE